MPESPGRPSVERIVLVAVLLIVLVVGGWWLLKPGAQAKHANSGTGAIPTRPAAASGAYASPKAQVSVTPSKPGKQAKPGHHAVKPMTRGAYLKAGNKICAKMNAATKALGDFPSEPKAQAAFVVKNFAIAEHARKQLMALPAPAGSEAKLASYYADVTTLDGTGKALAAALSAGQVDQAKALEQTLATQSDKANAEFTAYGLTVCGEP